VSVIWPRLTLASAARSVPWTQLIFTVILVEQLSVLGLIAGKYSRERILATNGPAPTIVFLDPVAFLDPVSKVERLEAALSAIAGTGGEN